MTGFGDRAFWSGRRVFVTGGAGFIGSRLVESLVDLEASVTVAVHPELTETPSRLLDIADRIRIRQVELGSETALLPHLAGIDVVLHLAGKTGPGVLLSSQNQARMLYENLRPFLSVLEASRRAGVGRFLVCSSACIYPRDAHNPISEDDGFMGMPEPANEGYGMAKRYQEYAGAQYARDYGMHVAIARLFNTYGPGDHFDARASHVIPALIGKALEATDTIEVWGTGEATRSFLYLDDCVRGLIAVAERAPAAVPINIGPAGSTTIRELAGLIARCCGKPHLKLKFDTSKPEGQVFRSADISRAERLLGFRPAVTLEEGLRRTLAWREKELFQRQVGV